MPCGGIRVTSEERGIRSGGESGPKAALSGAEEHMAMSTEVRFQNSQKGFSEP